MTSDLSTPACESLKKSRWPVEGSGGVGWGGEGGGLIWEFGNSSAHLHIKKAWPCNSGATFDDSFPADSIANFNGALSTHRTAIQKDDFPLSFI